MLSNNKEVVRGKPLKPRKGITFDTLGFKIERLDTYRTMNPWWQRLWKPKYNCHLLAMTRSAIYDVCSPQTKECSKLFAGVGSQPTHPSKSKAKKG